MYNLDSADKDALLNNKQADFEIRVISRKKAKETLKRGIHLHILGDVIHISQSEMLAKAKKIAPLSSICVKTPTFFTPPIKYELEKSLILLKDVQYPQNSKLRKSLRLTSSIRGGGSLVRIEGKFGIAPAISSGGIRGMSRSLNIEDSCDSGTTQNYSGTFFMEKMVYVMIEDTKKEITEEKRKIKQKEKSLERQKTKLEEKKKKLSKLTEMYYTAQKMNEGKATDDEAAEKLKQVSLPNDDKKLLCENFEESRLMTTMLAATEQFLGSEHIRVEEATRWSDYHVAICLQYYLHVNKYGNPSLLYGLRSKYFNYFKSETKFKTLRSYRQYCDVMRQLTKNEFDRLILEGIGVDKNTTIGRTSLRQWYNTYWQLSEIFKKHIYLPPSKEKTAEKQ
ncbi:MAG: hypothetical protein J6Y38_00275 [Bacteroidaceae bacterium]|nr:hypothetical protein [Bacteroidaceae bacterium]